jgi:branched-chain amino acid transport system ATP-binding protein
MVGAGLTVSNVSVKFGGLTALESVSFAVEPGTVVGVIGPNGAGKTTLFNVICGFVQPADGSLYWEGSLLRPRPDRLARHGIARTLQGVGLFAHLSALENVMVGGAGARQTGFASALFALPRSDRDDRAVRESALNWLARLEIPDAAHRLPGTLPYPIQKRVALARALIGKPRLLLLDEPAGGLGAEDMGPLSTFIRGLPTDVDAPCSVLLVEHHMDLVMSVCDHVVVLDFGRRVAMGTPDEVRADPAVAAAYLGQDVDTAGAPE